MKIIKKEFTIENLVMINDELTVNKTKKTLYFTMDLKAHKLIEEKLNKPLVSLFCGKDQNDLMSKLLSTDITLTLASACYVDVSNGVPRHDEFTMQEFIDSDIAQVATNQDLLYELIEMVVEYFGVNKNTQTGGKQSKKK